MNKLRMLLIEEDEISREVLQLMLGDKFDLSVLDDMGKAKDCLYQNDFEIVVLDMSTKHSDCLALCRSISNHPSTHPPIVIALGEKSDDESIRKIFEAGVHDYFIKPYNIVLFNESVMRLANSMQAYTELEQSDKASKSAFEIALGQSSYYGFALELIANLSTSQSFEQLADCVLQHLATRGICCAIQFRTSQHTYTFEEDRAEAGERTIQVFQLLSNQGRIYRFGNRLMFNDTHVSLLVKSMDDSSQGNYDSVLDIGAKIVPPIEAKLKAVIQSQLIEENQGALKAMINQLNNALDDQIRHNKNVVEHVSKQIAASFDLLEMTEQQEQFFVHLVETEMQEESDNSPIIELQDMVNTLLQKTESEQQDPIKESKSVSSPTASFSDVELF
ncbi:response regulator [Aliiglaciecola sp.]|nr:response regulator [Aliiglaciecola sp.]